MADIKKSTDTMVFDSGAYGITARTSNPTAETNTGFFFSKDVSGVIQGFYMDDAGTATQITGPGAGTTPHLIEWGTTKNEIVASDGALTTTIAGTQRRTIDASGNLTYDLASQTLNAGGFYVTCDGNATLYHINLKTTSGSSWGIILDSASDIKNECNDNFSIHTNGTPVQRLDINSSGGWDIDAFTYYVDATSLLRMRSTFDDATFTNSIELTTTSGVSGGNIKVDSASDIINECDNDFYVYTNGTPVQRLKVDSSGAWDIDAFTYYVDATSLMRLRSTFDDTVFTDSIVIETTSAVNGGNIKVDSAGDFFVDTNGVQRLEIDSSGRVGIASNTCTVEATGLVRLRTSYDNGAITDSIELTTTSGVSGGDIKLTSARNLGIDVVGSVFVEADYYFYIHTNATPVQRLRIDSSGDWDLDSGTFDLDATGDITLTSESDVTVSGLLNGIFLVTGAGQTLEIDGSNNWNLDAVDLDIDTSSATTIDAASFSVTGVGTSLAYHISLITTDTGSSYGILFDSAGSIKNECDSIYSIWTNATAVQRLTIDSDGDWDADSHTFDLDSTGIMTLTSHYDASLVYGMVLQTISDTTSLGMKFDSNRLIHMQADSGLYVYTNGTPAQRLYINSSGAWDVDGSSFDIDATGSVYLDAGGDIILTATSDVILWGTDTITLSGSASTDCTINITSTGSGDINLNSDADMSLTSDTTFYVKTGTSSTQRLAINSAGVWDVDSAGFTLTATSDITIDGAVNTYIQADSRVYIQGTGTVGAVTVSSTGTGDILLDSDDYLYLRCDSNLYLQTGTSSLTRMTVTSTGDVNFSSNTKVSTGGETSPDVDDGGLCLNQGSGDLKILSFKSSDVSQPFSVFAEADTYGYIEKRDDLYGGLMIVGMCESSASAAMHIVGMDQSPNALTTTSATAPILLTGADDASGNMGTIASGSNIFVVRNVASSKFIIKGDGQVYSQYAAAIYTYLDDEDDLALLRAAQQKVGGVKPEQEAMDRLVELGIINNDGFASMQQMTRLQMGAMHQMFNGMKYLAKKFGVTEMELSEAMRA